MNPTLWLCILLPLLLIVTEESCAGRIRLGRRRKRKGRVRMNELIQSFLGKRCVLHAGSGWGGDWTGTIEAVEGSWVSVRTDKGVELINLDYISRISACKEKKKT